MADITYENLIAARKSKATDTGEFDIMGMANIALNILEQVNNMKGNQGGRVMQSRPPEQGTAITKPAIDVDQIAGALKTVKSLKGDIKISELEKLLHEHKEQISSLLGKL